MYPYSLWPNPDLIERSDRPPVSSGLAKGGWTRMSKKQRAFLAKCSSIPTKHVTPGGRKWLAA